MENNNNYNGVIAPESVPSMNMEPEKKKSNKKTVLLVGIVVLLAVAVALYFGWQKFNDKSTSGTNAYENAINNVYELLSNSIKNSPKSEFEMDLNKPYTLGLNATFNSNMAELKGFSGLKYGLNVGIDMSKEEAIVGASIKDSSSSILDLLVYFVNNNAYLKSEQIISRVINVGTYNLFDELDIDALIDYSSSDVKIDYDELDYMLASYKNILIRAIDRNKITVADENLTIDGKEYKTKKSSYTFDKAEAERFTRKIIEGVLNDDKLLDYMAQTINQDKSAISSALNDALKEIDFNDYETVIMNLYTDSSNKVLAGTIVTSGEEVARFEDVDKFKINITGGDESFSIQENNDSYVLSFKDSGTEIINLKIYKSDKDFKMDYILNIDGVKANGVLGFSNIKETKTKVSGDFEFSFNMSFMGEKIDFALDGEYSLETGNIKTFDTSNSLKVEDLTEEEQMEIYTKMQSILGRLGLGDVLDMGGV